MISYRFSIMGYLKIFSSVTSQISGLHPTQAVRTYEMTHDGHMGGKTSGCWGLGKFFFFFDL